MSLLLLTVQEAARFLSMSESWMRRKIRKGDVRVVRFGRVCRVHASDIWKLADEKIVGTPNGVSSLNTGERENASAQMIETTVQATRAKRGR